MITQTADGNLHMKRTTYKFLDNGVEMWVIRGLPLVILVSPKGPAFEFPRQRGAELLRIYHKEGTVKRV